MFFNYAHLVFTSQTINLHGLRFSKNVNRSAHEAYTSHYETMSTWTAVEIWVDFNDHVVIIISAVKYVKKRQDSKLIHE